MTNHVTCARYTTVFFDLDHTLWDYETSAKETLQELFDQYRLETLGIPAFDNFHQQFRVVNQQLWHLYDHGKIDSEIIRRERFKQILGHFGIVNEPVSLQLSSDYLNHCPRKGNLMPGAIDTLNYLAERYSLTVITNGFEDIQRIKLEAGNIAGYFQHIITSQKAGHKKPAREIFDFALSENAITADQAIMIGDNLATDIAGAKNASVDVIFYNPDRLEHQAEVNHEIHQLHELCSLL
jgi:YjjG family noncanonical pyrimidine nucleotidase